MIAQRVAILGLGLIGGSLARALRNGGLVQCVVGYDVDARQRELARDLEVVDVAAGSAHEAVRDAELIVLAVPVLQTGKALAACLPGRAPEAVVTDVGSTKRSVLDDVARVCGGKAPPWFVAGHPIAGTEKSGVAHSVADLFRGHRVILTPDAGTDPVALDLVARVWTACGARVVRMEADRHDAIFAATSHLPHLLAYGFVDMLARLDTREEIFPNAGGGFRDFTRIASSSPEMWHDVIRANAPAVTTLLRRQIADLQGILTLMERGAWPEVREVFARARSARERYLAQIE